jgi:hypothetical protein
VNVRFSLRIIPSRNPDLSPFQHHICSTTVSTSYDTSAQPQHLHITSSAQAGNSPDLNGFCLQIFIKSLQATFAAVPRLLDTAKWSVREWEVPSHRSQNQGRLSYDHARAPDSPIVHSDRARLNHLRHPQRSRYRLGVNASCHNFISTSSPNTPAIHCPSLLTT